MKRKAEEEASKFPARKRIAAEANGPAQLRTGLLQQADDYHKQYSTSQPYKHGVISNLLDPQLLRKVRAEIQENLSFTPKETDIYRIHQSGDLANLDGLDDSSLKLLPSLLTLRNALYSSDFRGFLETVTGAGHLSGKKTDMAINVYTPGCHLLCHDDVIGSRRLSYILYLTDPDRPWKPQWGGALRLYPTIIHKTDDGKEIKMPSPDFSVSIPPAFNQLSFFAVQPGESFHDVEEVYAHRPGSDDDSDVLRVRMAISGWYHIPQKGEDGYVEGLEESLAERSSLQQLQGSADQYDLPQSGKKPYKTPDQEEHESATVHGIPAEEIEDETLLSEEDLEFLLKYIAPTYLTPDTLESISDTFSDECSISLGKFLNRKFSASLGAYLSKEELKPLPSSSEDIKSTTAWQVARPPHKHHFLYQKAMHVDSSSSQVERERDFPIQDVLQNLLPSHAFRKWLHIATGLKLSSYDFCARRFRRGKDYTLATGYTGRESQLEIILAITPSQGWGGGEGDLANAEADEGSNVTQQANGAGVEEDAEAQSPATKNDGCADPAVGGYVAYMAGDDDDENNDKDTDDDHDNENDNDNEAAHHSSDDGVKVPTNILTKNIHTSSNGLSVPPKDKQTKADPAVYKAANNDEDDGVLFSMPACWNTLAIVLRDKGVMRFVKYVSRDAPGDRWDVLGEFGVVEEEEGGEEEASVREREELRGAGIGIGHEESETEVESESESDNDNDDDDDS